MWEHLNETSTEATEYEATTRAGAAGGCVLVVTVVGIAFWKCEGKPWRGGASDAPEAALERCQYKRTTSCQPKAYT